MSDRNPVRAVDLFCGAGGLSTGLALACEELDRDIELAAVNHWDTAIETHERNHPWADHYHSGVEALKPIEVPPKGDIDVFIAAPSCTDHSKARGGQPVNPQDRMSPFAILDWIAQMRPKSVLIENVPEFKKWGPVIDGQPTRNAQFFQAWKYTMEGREDEDGLGYNVSHRELTAADYGDPTSRKRLFVVARRDDAPVWPEPTHSENGEQPGTDEWRSAAEIIDWSERGQSIWSRGLRGNGKKPLAESTMERIAQGIRRYGHDDLQPFADVIESLDRDAVRDLQDHIVPVEEAADRMLQAEKVADGESAFARWRETYGVEIEAEEGDSDTLSMKYQPSDRCEAREILRAGANKWADLTDQTNKQFAFRHDLDVTLASGQQLNVENWANWFGGTRLKLGDKTFG